MSNGRSKPIAASLPTPADARKPRAQKQRARLDGAQSKVSVFLRAGAFRHFGEISLERNMSKNQIMLDAYNDWLTKHGYPTLAELDPEAE